MKYTFLFICIWLIGCASETEKYLANTNLPPQKILAIKSGRIINGMTPEEVKVALGEPTFIEAGKGKFEERWIYRLLKKGELATDVNRSKSMFPQGIAFIVPYYYRPIEVKIDFVKGNVSQVQEILSW